MLKIERDVSLKEHTTFKIGGKAKYFFEARAKEEVIKAVKWAKERSLPFFVLGGGSNILVSDKGFSGLVLKMENECFQVKDNVVFTEAGVKLSELIKVSVKKGLGGIEWAAGIPGITVGGALYSNAGAFGQRMADIVKEVEVLDAATLEARTIPKADCCFNYKESIFKTDKNLIILSALLQFEKTDKQRLRERVKYVSSYRKQYYPPEPSAGCVFKNPSGQTPAALLIDKSGFKGKRIGQAQVSKQHANFIVNLGGATAREVLRLVKLVKKEVKEKTSVQLEEEIRYLGF